MALKLMATQYRVTHQGWVYTISYNRKRERWTVNRHNVVDAPIPPMTQAFTEKGWIHLFKSEVNGGHKAFDNPEACSRMIEEQSDA